MATLYKEFKLSSGISIDSRKIKPNCIYFALKGPNNNGNKYAHDAIKKGARLAVIDEPDYHTNPKTLLFEDSLIALQDLAKTYRELFSFPIIGITGTNGKTTTKELVYAVLSQELKTRATAGNFNNHIGVPLTLLSFPKDLDIGIVEMGANHVGEIKELCEISKPNSGLITNIGKAHLEGFGSYENIIEAKSELYQYISDAGGKIYLNQSDKLLCGLLNPEKIKIINYGLNLVDISKDKLNLSFRINIKGKTHTINTNLFGNYNLTNVMAAITIGLDFNISIEKIILAIESYHPQNNRSQVEEIGSNQLIVDCYNANPTSMQAAINNFSEIAHAKKIIILGEMKEMGEESLNEHALLVEQIRKLEGILKIYYVGTEFIRVIKSNQPNEIIVSSVKELEEAICNTVSHSLVLIKGSRSNKLEEIKECFNDLAP